MKESNYVRLADTMFRGLTITTDATTTGGGVTAFAGGTTTTDTNTDDDGDYAEEGKHPKPIVTQKQVAYIVHTYPSIQS